MGNIDWNNVLYFDKTNKLLLNYQEFCTIPDAIINLYHNRVKLLDLSFNKLTSVKGLSFFINLDELILDNNNLNDSISFSKKLNRLKLLSINNNKIENLDLFLIKTSISFPFLEYLSLLNNPACPLKQNNFEYNEIDYQKYRLKVIEYFPKLKFLDSTCVTKAERQYTIQMKVDIKENPKNFMDYIKEMIKIEKPNYHPLPSALREPNDIRGVYGKRRYRYIGAHSEGNRFILNNDL